MLYRRAGRRAAGKQREGRAIFYGRLLQHELGGSITLEPFLDERLNRLIGQSNRLLKN